MGEESEKEEEMDVEEVSESTIGSATQSKYLDKFPLGKKNEKEEEMDVEEVSESTTGAATQSISPTIVNNTSNTAKEETADEASDDEAQEAVI